MWRSGADDIEVLKSEVAGVPTVALRQGLLSGGRIPRNFSGFSALTAPGQGRESADG